MRFLYKYKYSYEVECATDVPIGCIQNS